MSDDERQSENGAEPITPEEWLLGNDTGVSSVAIYAAMTGSRYDRRLPCYPYDPYDFGRCYRLLALFPAWQARMPEVAVRFPEWGPLVAIWPELTAMYEVLLKARAQHGEPAYPSVRGRARLSAKKRAEIAKFEAHPATQAYRAMYERMVMETDACMAAAGWTKTAPGGWERRPTL